ncbi:hypothetical protein Pmani_015731 [Petrolisthes manimaculis]|uniref:Uncharacterized protein n=1 Tax=Petrolisthes manimaculis TaxID=1843537 RepID=A0AAE1PR07_9EUCA|nr:hypothetical protein Pmani_015731 [Petrolisthes manimaculis]
MNHSKEGMRWPLVSGPHCLPAYLPSCLVLLSSFLICPSSCLSLVSCPSYPAFLVVLVLLLTFACPSFLPLASRALVPSTVCLACLSYPALLASPALTSSTCPPVCLSVPFSFCCISSCSYAVDLSLFSCFYSCPASLFCLSYHPACPAVPLVCCICPAVLPHTSYGLQALTLGITVAYCVSFLTSRLVCAIVVAGEVKGVQ